MKLFLLADLYETADRWHAALIWCACRVQHFRVWAWMKLNEENLRSCNVRRPVGPL